MKQQANLKGFALIVFVLSFAGLLLYWVHKNDSISTVGPSAGAIADHKDRPKGQRNAPSVDRDSGEIASRFPHQASPLQRNYRINHATISTGSLSFNELAQEIRAQNPEEADLFLPIANLATGHPNAQVREQGIAYLAQSGDERSVIFLITALMDTELHIRQLSLNALFQRGNRVPVQPLVEFALNDAGAMRSQVVALIRQIAGAGSDEVARLEAQLRDYSTNE